MDQGNSGNNAINNYKGVMLCSRPNQNQATTTQKPFCARVVPRQQIGLVPVKQQGKIIYQTKKPRLQILDRHKKWLQKFKKDVQSKKNQIEQSKKQQEQKFNRIKQLAQVDRQRSKKMRQQYNSTATNVLNILDGKQSTNNSNNMLSPENLQRLNKINDQKNQQSQKIIKNKQNSKNNEFKKKNKGSKPLWAKTQQQIQKNQDEQVDQLLDFFSTNHVEDYMQDQQVKDILSNLKNKIEVMREEQIGNKNKWIKLNKKDKKKDKNKIIKIKMINILILVIIHKLNQQQAKSLNVSYLFMQLEKIQQLRTKKKQQQDWDKFTTSQKSSIANIDQKIAKNIADQVLRNYPNMRGVHSNVSIRKLLQAQAARVMNQPISRPVITTIIRQKQKIDANNLPYLHRNPAI